MQERNFPSRFLNRSLGFGSRQHNDGSGLPMQITSWRFLFRLNFYNKGQTFFFVSNCLQGIELTQADLSARDLLEGHWENITESNPCVSEPGKVVPTLTICLWGHTVSLSAPLSQYGVHSSSSLWTSRISSLIQSCGPNVACCLNPGLTEPHKSGTCSSLPGILVPTSWERESGDPSGGQQWPRMGLIGLPPAYSRSSETVVLREGPLAMEALWRCELHCHSGPQWYPVVKAV